jgi:hypothetical protein
MKSICLQSEDRWPVKCCTEVIPTRDVLRHIGRKERKRFHQREREWSTPVEKRIYCAAAECGRFIPLSAIIKNRSCAKCKKCRTKVCTQCLSAWHGKDDCPQEIGLQDILAVAESEGWRRCYKCRAMIEKTYGCSWMKCRCGATFCYQCGLRRNACYCTSQYPVTNRVHTAKPEYILAEPEHGGEASSAPAELPATISSQATQVAQDKERTRTAVANLRNREIFENISAIIRKYAAAREELEQIHESQKQLILERWKKQDQELSNDRQDAMNRLGTRSLRSLDYFKKEYEDHIAFLNTLDESFFPREEMVAGSKHYLEVLKRPNGDFPLHPYFEKEKAECEEAIRLQQEGKLGTKKQQIRQFIRDSTKRLDESKKTYREALSTLDLTFRQYESGMHEIILAESRWVDAVIEKRQSMLQEMEMEEIVRARENLQ